MIQVVPERRNIIQNVCQRERKISGMRDVKRQSLSPKPRFHEEEASLAGLAGVTRASRKRPVVELDFKVWRACCSERLSTKKKSCVLNCRPVTKKRDKYRLYAAVAKSSIICEEEYKGGALLMLLLVVVVTGHIQEK